MRKTLILLTLINTALFLLAALSYAPGKKIKRYKVKSGIIELQVSGMQQGKETIYFDDWGLLEAKYTHTVLSIMGMKQETNTLTLIAGDSTYSIDLNTKTGTKMETPFMSELSKNAKTDDLTDVGKKMMQQMGGKKTGMEKIAGKRCEVWEIKSMGSKTWIWNGVSLKTEVNFGGMKMSSEAKSAKFNVPIPPEKVKMPAGVTISNMPNPKLPGMNFKF